MSIPWDPAGRVNRIQMQKDRRFWNGAEVGEHHITLLTDALDECVAALRAIYIADSFYHATLTARDTLRKLGVEP